MKVFVGWPGERSKSAAEALGNWTARVIQAVEPWISSGIEKGARWQTEIADRLEEAKVGIICLTASNLSEPWILFEAGALSKTKGSYVCTFLLDVSPADIESPLAQFQHTSFKKEEVLNLMQTINRLVEANGERSLSEESLTKVFEKFWPDLENELREITSRRDATVVHRSDRQLLEEILEILRGQEKRAQAKPVRVRWETLSEPLSGVTAPSLGRDMYDLLLREKEAITAPPRLDVPPEIVRAAHEYSEGRDKAKVQRDSKPQSTET